MFPLETGFGAIEAQALSEQIAPEHLSVIALVKAIRDILVRSKGTLIA